MSVMLSAAKHPVLGLRNEILRSLRMTRPDLFEAQLR